MPGHTEMAGALTDGRGGRGVPGHTDSDALETGRVGVGGWRGEAPGRTDQRCTGLRDAQGFFFFFLFSFSFLCFK